MPIYFTWWVPFAGVGLLIVGVLYKIHLANRR
jgi:hypothetical protein